MVSFLCSGTLLFGGVTRSLQQTATVLQPGSYEAGAAVDFILNRGGGVNFSGAFRAGLLEDQLDVEAFIGSGKTDFLLGGDAKFNFLPDIPGQIGLAFLGGAALISDDYRGRDRDLIATVTLAAIGSKKYETDFGSIAPYAALEVEFLFADGDNEVPFSGILGSEWLFQDVNPWVFYSELDFDISKSVFLLSFGGAYRF